MANIKDKISELQTKLESDHSCLPVVCREAEALAESDAENAWLRYEIAGIFDSTGHEAEACVWYERLLDLGIEKISKDEVPHFWVAYGSTLRNVGRLADSERVLREALAQWPRFSALQFFLALALMSQGRHLESIVALAELQLRQNWDDSIVTYRRAVESYLVEELRPAVK